MEQLNNVFTANRILEEKVAKYKKKTRYVVKCMQTLMDEVNKMKVNERPSQSNTGRSLYNVQQQR